LQLPSAIASFRFFLPCCLLALGTAAAHAQSRLETRIAIEQLAEAGDVSAAAALSPELIELARLELGDDSEDLADSYVFVAEIYSANRDFRAAEESILNALAIYERQRSPLSSLLIDPYASLGDAYQAAGEHALAYAAFGQARDLSRRSFGLHNSRQIALVRKMADSAYALGDEEESIELQVQAIELVQRAHGPVSFESFEAISHLASWLSEHRYYRAAGTQYRVAANLLRFGLDSDPLEVVRTLRFAASNFRLAPKSLEGYKPPPSELLSALEIVRGLPEDNPELRAAIHRDIGDWHVAFDNKWEIEAPYLRAWQILSDLEDGDEIQREWFSSTVPVYLATFRSGKLSHEADAPQGSVTLRFRVNENGTADDIEVTSSRPENLLNGAARRRVNNSRFRPAIANGRVVASTGVMAFEFGYEDRFDDE
jgi:TonB family protein